MVGLSDEQWRRAVARLREVRLLAPVDPSDPEALDAHPLVPEWFGERARLTIEAGWRAAHSRLYDHLRRSTREGQTPTLADLAPLYHAIAHGCLAERHQETLDEVYRARICRRDLDGRIEFYATKKLGAVGSNLAAISWFFNRPYETPASSLTPLARAFAFSQAGFGLRAQGRLQEALPAMSATLRMMKERRSWGNATVAASNVSDTELLIGDLVAATASAETAVELADRTADAFHMVSKRTTWAIALLAAGEVDMASDLFADAERRQREWHPHEPFLYSEQGYRYCDLLLSRGRAAAVRDRAAQTIDIAQRNNWVLDIALDTLTLGRAHIALALQGATSDASASADVRVATTNLDEAVEGIRGSGFNEHVPRGLLARAAFRRAVGDWDGARRDLDEALEIAEPGPMRLFFCDIALERARLALAQRWAFAPLNGLVAPTPPPPHLPDAAAAAWLKDEARKQLDVARKVIAECGYHRHDEELAELDAVVAGRRGFADLPSRV
jgi:tetratricopeptide (TPR) repeat protein